MSADLAARFWAKVDKSGPTPAHRPELGPCWLWRGGLRGGGYGQFWRAGRVAQAHVVAYELSSGEEVPAGAAVIHQCDARSCCNPAHLQRATQLLNIRDMHAKRRAVVRRGEQHHKAKLSHAKLDQARRLVERGVRIATLASDLGVSPKTLRQALKGRTWAEPPASPGGQR